MATLTMAASRWLSGAGTAGAMIATALASQSVMTLADAGAIELANERQTSNLRRIADMDATTTSYTVGFTWVSTVLTWGGIVIALSSFCLNLANTIHKW